MFFWSLWTLPVVYVSAVIDGGSHPFPFRTRKLSLLSPMVLGLRARESRSLQDSRGPSLKRRGASSFIWTARAASRQGRSGRRSLSRPRLVNTSRLSLTPLAVNGERGFFYARSTSLRSRDHSRSIPAACRSRPPAHKAGGLFVFTDRSALRLHSHLKVAMST